jgi:hypothetical protein
MFVDRSVPRISHLWERFSFISSMKARLTGLIQTACDAGQLPKNVDPHVVFRILSTAMLGAAVTHSATGSRRRGRRGARPRHAGGRTHRLRTGFAFKFVDSLRNRQREPPSTDGESFVRY